MVGLPYLIVLKSGTGSVTIPNFIVTNIDSVDLGRITDSCAPPDYVLSSTPDSADEGSSVTITLNTQNVPTFNYKQSQAYRRYRILMTESHDANNSFYLYGVELISKDGVIVSQNLLQMGRRFDSRV